jgi:predicted GIY-YIG superfamily endonuclease
LREYEDHLHAVMSRAKEEYKNKLYAAQWEKIPKSWSKVEKIKIIIEN